MNTPGLAMLCRDLYGEHADPERLPLSARFDEVDATLVFDDVLVPWDRIFVYRNPSRAAMFHGRISGLWAGYSTLVRLAVKLDVFIGLADLLSQWAGRKDRGMQVAIGQLVADREILLACLRTAETDATRTAAGFLAPRLNRAYRVHGIEAADRAVRLLQDVLTSSLVLTGGASDLAAAAIGPYVERFFRNNAPTTRDHLRLLAIAADATVSSFAGRSQLYERLQSGEPDNMRAQLYRQTDRTASTQRLLQFIHDDTWSAPSATH